MLNRKIFTLTESNSDIIFLTDVSANGKISKLEKNFCMPHILTSYIPTEVIKKGELQFFLIKN